MIANRAKRVFAPNTLDDLRGYAELAARYSSVPLIVGALGEFHTLDLVELAAARRNLHLDLSSALQVFAIANPGSGGRLSTNSCGLTCDEASFSKIIANFQQRNWGTGR
ncbi:hypothetical protein ACFXHA_20450 [Nocardia sp. NPDC059240]|uniref:hypothetical protein n=1 Tax=Nocardia sp. NPDC059240 TaxID=3346786 RepID=UPI0036B10218